MSRTGSAARTAATVMSKVAVKAKLGALSLPLLKVLVVAAIVLVAAAIVLVVGLMAIGAARGGESGLGSCVADTGPVGDLDDEQAGNARVIVAVGASLGVPERGIAVALATAAQESSLRNLNHGDRDSLGLFQQRPSSGWGTADQVQDPHFAAAAFFGGPDGPHDGEPPGLLDIDGWQSMELTVAAQAVQRSAYPDAYAGWEADAWLWLSDIVGPGPGGVLSPPAAAPGCPPHSWEGKDPAPLVTDVASLRARAQAFAAASADGRPDPFFGASHYYRLCAQLAARVHGRPHSGFATAAQQWQHYLATGLAVTDSSPPPPGALLFYTNAPSGHVAVYLGGGLVVSNDVLDRHTGRRGGVYIVPMSELTDGAWNLPYVGWAPPAY